ncbi:MAG: hypothetical protein V1737_03940, partial [Chloroflexota bacterium]
IVFTIAISDLLSVPLATYSIPFKGDRHIRPRSKIHTCIAFCKRLRVLRFSTTRKVTTTANLRSLISLSQSTDYGLLSIPKIAFVSVSMLPGEKTR